MNIIRTSKKENRFLQVDLGCAVNDRELKGCAHRLLLLMLSKRNDWNFNMQSVLKEIPYGRDAIRSALNRLTELGYCVVNRQRDPKTGKFSKSTYRWYESRELKECSPRPEKPAPVCQTRGLYKDNSNIEISNINQAAPKVAPVSSSFEESKKETSYPKPANPIKPKNKKTKPVLKDVYPGILLSDKQYQTALKKAGRKEILHRAFEMLANYKIKENFDDGYKGDFFQLEGWAIKAAEKKFKIQDDKNDKIIRRREACHSFFKEKRQIIFDKGIEFKVSEDLVKIGYECIYYDDPRFSEVMKTKVRNLGLHAN